MWSTQRTGNIDRDAGLESAPILLHNDVVELCLESTGRNPLQRDEGNVMQIKVRLGIRGRAPLRLFLPRRKSDDEEGGAGGADIP